MSVRGNRPVDGRVLSIAGLVLYGRLSPVLAESPEIAKKTVQLHDQAIGSSQVFDVVFGLFIVLALIFALAWGVRRFGNLNTFNRGQIRILGGVSLGHREKAVLLEIEGERLLIGVTGQQVNLLHRLPSKAGTDQAVSEEQPENAVNSESFDVQLQKIKGGEES